MIRKRYHGMNLFDGFRFMFSKKPYYIVFHPTARCNCKCSFCFNWKGVKNAKEEDELKLEEINRVSKNLGYVKYLTISGGEPFLRDDVAEICKIFYDNNKTKSIAIHTNCSFPEKVEATANEILKSCNGIKLTVCPSADALHDEHDRLRGYNGLFTKVEETITRLKQLQQIHGCLCILPVGVFLKATEDNAFKLSHFFMQRYNLLHAKAIPRGDIKYGFMPNLSKYSTYTQKGFTWLSSRERLRFAFENFRNTLDNIKTMFIIRKLKTGGTALKCSAGIKTITILPNGDVAACEPYLNKEKFIMGNLRSSDYDIKKLLSLDKAKKVKDYIKESKCSCTWECIIPINMLFDKRQTLFILRGYIKNLISVVFCLSKFIGEEAQRRFYTFYGRNSFLKLVKISTKVLRVSAKSAIRSMSFKREKCDVLLINSPYDKGWITSEVKPHNEEPLGIMSIAAFLRSKNFKVRIIDMLAEEMRTKDVIRYIKRAQPRIVGLSAITRQANIAYDLGREIKKYFPKVHLVYGGVHPTFFPEEPFEKGYADVVVVGEGEQTMLDICNSLLRKGKNFNQINGLAYKKDGSLNVNKPRQFISNIDSIPSPAYDLLKGKYQTNIHIPPLNKERAFSIMASRGCPYNCHYCSIPTVWKRTLRHKSPKHVIAEIRNAITQHKVKNFHFYDDDFLINERFVSKFCNLLMKEGLNVTWLCQSRTSSIVRHRNLVPLLKKAGCKVIELGIESCDEQVMQSMNKMQRLNDVKESVRIIREQGMEVLPLMIAFYPRETLDSVYHTSELMINLGLWSNNNIEVYTRKDSSPECNGAPFVHGFFTTPIPGSILYDHAEKEGLIFTKDWEDYKFSRVNFVPKSFLDDTPVKVSVMGKKEFFQNMLRYKNTISYYNLLKRENVIGNFKAPQDYFEFLYSVYHKCDGKLTVQKVCMNLSDYHNTILVYVTLRFLAMFGFIRSRR